ncbi:MAG TPA: CAAX protease [Ignavibacteria bacterium]|nr:CAAX protease [Bacteroidota bacterium]HCN38318.1 CAAX protease [Bacteroidota bacterium]HRF66836.1 CAAX protease [Ignavibacteria bacterium]HRJ03795.1 CAAX protease [Ignavibacteria bacterium]
MKYSDFENIMSPERMGRYFTACRSNSRKSMTLYRKNLELTQELFTIISCFEIALRNATDNHYKVIYGNDWLRNSALPAGMFNTPHCGKTPSIISFAVRKLGGNYSHSKLIAEMDFGFWRYMFARHQYYAGGQTLLRIFPSKPTSSALQHYDHNYVFAKLEELNELRNRLAHHEPVVFRLGHAAIDTSYSRNKYALMMEFFKWMDIDETSLLYGLDHVVDICDKIDSI